MVEGRRLRLAAVFAAAVLALALPAAAQSPDPFRSVAPPAPAPVPPPRPRPAPAPEAAPAVVAPQPPAPPPRNAFDGVYAGRMMITRDAQQKGSTLASCADFTQADRRMTIENGQLSVEVINNGMVHIVLKGSVNSDGAATAFAPSPAGGWRFTGQVRNGKLTGAFVNGIGCDFAIDWRK